jgi:5-formyltetrahydrofolate cyclo-ligase
MKGVEAPLPDSSAIHRGFSLKKTLRKQVLAVRDRLSPEERAAKSRAIGEKLFALPEFISARAVMFFASFRSEVDTVPMIRRALTSGKRVVLPKVKGRALEFFEITDYESDVVPGTWGIPEPAGSRPVDLAQIDFIVTPGAAFDERGNRLGYGAGYYDKILSSFRGTAVALAFEEQIIKEIPVDAHDIPVRKIVTEKRVITTQRA